MRPITTLMLAAAVAVPLAVAGPAAAEILKFKATLTGAAETPPTDSAGTGVADVQYDTELKALSWTVTFANLSGDVTAAHFHGPAAEGAKADPVVPIKGNLKSPISGTSTLTPEQAADLQKELWYFNLHTAKYPDGEVRGQLLKQ
ncbi:MAG TPA: CHRD domain-containing protein [Bauldia sp.]|nr:CHRD domain-containing protein [Bauldia sp.]